MTVPADLASEVVDALTSRNSPPGAQQLWLEIFEAYARGGPDAVWDALEKKVKTIRKAASAQATDMRAAAGSVERKGRSKRRR